MQMSEQINEIAPALARAQANLPAVAKTATNPTFNSMYATLDAVTNAVLAACAPEGLVVIQGTADEDESGLSVVTTLLHVSGQWYSNRVRIPLEMQRRKDGTTELTAQRAASAITYGRRIGLSAFFAIVSEDDDDGEAASRASHRHQEPERTRPPETRPAERTRGPSAVTTEDWANGKEPPPGAPIPAMPGKPGMHFKDRNKRAWAGEPITSVPLVVIREALDYLQPRADDPTNKYRDRTRADVQLLLDEVARRMSGRPAGTKTQSGGPGMPDDLDVPPSSLDVEEDELPF